VIHLPSLVDFDYYFLFVGWWQYAAAAGISLSSSVPALRSVLALFKINLPLIELLLFLQSLLLFLIAISS
jgi:hypothetical protein